MSACVHLLVRRSSGGGKSRCGQVSTKPGWNQGGQGTLTVDLNRVDCGLCLRYLDREPVSGSSEPDPDRGEPT